MISIGESFGKLGHFIAFRRELQDTINFNLNLKFGEDFDFSKRVYERFGVQTIHYNYRTFYIS